MQLTINVINNKIFEIRDTKVMLDRDLAIFYDVETRRLKEQVKRNIERFPEDFMFQLTKNEVDLMVSQNAIPSRQHLGGSLPFAFTELGVAMLSAVLKSKIAIEISIQIMRTFVAIKKYALTHDELAQKIEELENRVTKGEQIDKQILDVLHELISNDKDKTSKKIGFV